MIEFFKNAEKRGKAYAYTLLGCVAAIALIGLLGIWGLTPLDSTLYKLIVSLITIGALSGFLYTLSSDTDEKTSQRILYIIAGSAIALTILVLLQTWTSFMAELFFGKMISTLLVIGIFAAFILAVFDDFFENKKLKDENYLD